MGLVSKLKDKLHHPHSTPTSDSEDGTPARTPSALTKIADKISRTGTPLSSDSSSSGLAAAGGASKHALKMEKKREDKDARRREVEEREARDRKKDDDSWSALAGPDSTLLTDTYGFLPLMQSSSDDRTSPLPFCSWLRALTPGQRNESLSTSVKSRKR